MKVSIISHTYADKKNQEKILALSRYPDLSIQVIVPSYFLVRDTGHVLKPDDASGGNYAVSIVRPRLVLGGGMRFPIRFSAGTTFIYDPWPLYKALKDFRPDIIHLEQEPWSLSALEVTLINKAIKAKLITSTLENVDRRYPPPFRQIYRYVLSKTDSIMACTHEAKDILAQRGYRNASAVTYLGLDPQIYKRKDVTELKKQLRLSKFVIGYMGRLVPEKGVLDLVRACATLEGDFHLLIVGSGPLRDEVLRVADTLGIGDRLRLVPWVNYEHVADHLCLMDVFVHPSRTTTWWREQYNHTILEAMACEIPVICSDSGGNPRMVRDIGYIFRESDVEDLQEKIHLVMQDAAVRALMAKRGREEILQRYTHEKVAEGLYNFYHSSL